MFSHSTMQSRCQLINTERSQTLKQHLSINSPGHSQSVMHCGHGHNLVGDTVDMSLPLFKVGGI